MLEIVLDSILKEFANEIRFKKIKKVLFHFGLAGLQRACILHSYVIINIDMGETIFRRVCFILKVKI